MEPLIFRFGQPNLWTPPALSWDWGWYVSNFFYKETQSGNITLVMIGNGQKFFTQLDVKKLSDFIQSTLKIKGDSSTSGDTISFSISTFCHEEERTPLTGYLWKISFAQNSTGNINFLVTLTFPNGDKAFDFPEIEAKRLVNFLNEPFWSFGASPNEIFTDVFFGVDIYVGKNDYFWSFAYDQASINPFILFQFGEINGIIPIDIDTFKNLVSFVNGAIAETPQENVDPPSEGTLPPQTTFQLTSTDYTWTIGYPSKIFKGKFWIIIEVGGNEVGRDSLTPASFGMCYKWFSHLPPPFHQDVV